MIPNKYVMEIPAPPVLAGGDQNDLRQIAVRVSSLELPGKQLATSEVKYYGPFRKSPYATLYEDLNFTVMLSDDARERNYFTKWGNIEVHAGSYHFPVRCMNYFNSM